MASRAISVRLDDESERALAELTRRGVDRSQAIRDALVETAARRVSETLREEVARIAADPADRAEVAEIQQLLESLRAEPW